MSAAQVFHTDDATIPREIPYLSAKAELKDKWRRELAEVEGLKVGIVWQGSRDYAFDRWRSFPLAALAPLAAVSGVRLISLQKGFGSEQLRAVDFPVLNLADRLDEATGPFLDTAAVITNLDLVVTADTATAHLAGALGAPVLAGAGTGRRLALAARPRRFPLVSHREALPPDVVRPVVGRLSAHGSGPPNTPGAGTLTRGRRAGRRGRDASQRRQRVATIMWSSSRKR